MANLIAALSTRLPEQENIYNPSLEVGIEPTTVTFTVVRLYYYAIAVFIINFDSNQHLTIYKLIISFYNKF